MKYWIILVLLSTSVTAIFGQYEIKGTVQQFEDDDQVVLSQYNPVTQKLTTIESSEIANGKYAITYKFKEPDLYRVDFPGGQKVMLAVDEGDAAIRIHAEGKRGGKIKIEGSEESLKLQDYEAFRIESKERLIDPPYARRREARKAGDVQAEIDAVEDYVIASKAHRNELVTYTHDNIGTSFALYGTVLRWTGDDAVHQLDALVSAFEDEHPDLKATELMREKVERFKKVAIGVKAPEIKGPQPNGKMLDIADIPAKYILLDFWASWCGPCISQVPDLKNVYEDFHDQGFEIVSISVDRHADKWKSAIESLDLDWLHVSYAEGWESRLAKKYNVTFIPFNFLLDENGTIIAKNLHSATLYSRIEELLENQ